MSDLALQWNASQLAADVAVVANDLVRDDGLETAVLLSLFLDRRAEDGDELPDGETDRRGWWGDALPVVDGDRIGSRLWMLARAKPTRATLDRAQEYASEALQWLLDDQVAEAVDVAAEYTPEGWLALLVEVRRPDGTDPAAFRFDGAWRAMET